MTGRVLPPIQDRQEEAERDRIRRVYAAYSSDPHYRKIWSQNAASRFMLDRKWQRITEALWGADVDLTSARIIDLGAGIGHDAARFRDLGVGTNSMVALDLLEHRLHQAKRSYPWMVTAVADASRLPFKSACCDVVYQSTMLSSVLDAGLRERILEEVRRVLVPGGVFISYDARYPNPWNRNTRPVRAAELKKVFTGWHLAVWSLTPIPQLVRLLAPISIAACRVIDWVAPLRTHLLVLARKP